MRYLALPNTNEYICMQTECSAVRTAVTATGSFVMSGDAQDLQSDYKSSWGLFFRVFPSLMLPMFIAISDQTLISTALPSIAASLGDVGNISWVVVIYLMSATLAAPVYGRLGDLIGRRRMMLIALGFVICGALIAVTAQRLEFLILGRGVQGLGAGGLMTLTQAMIGQAIPLRHRGRYQGYLATVGTTATVTGPLLGGVLTHHFGWRATLSLSIPLAMIAMILALRLPQSTAPRKSTIFDGFGLIYFAATVLPFLMAVKQLRSIATGAPPTGLLLWLALAVTALVLLGRREKRAETPLFSLPLIAQPAIWRSACVAAGHGAAYVSLVAFTPLYLQVARGIEARHVGFILLALTMGTGMSSLTTGQLVSRTGRTLIFPSVMLSILVVILTSFAILSPGLETWQLVPFYFAMSLCFGSVMSVLQVTVQYVAGPADLGAAASVVQFSRALGAAIGTSLVGTIIFIGLEGGANGASEVFRAALEGGTATKSDAAVEADLLAAFRPAFLTIAAIVALECLIAWSIPVRSLTVEMRR